MDDFLGTALEDSKPIPGTDPVQYEPITIGVAGPAVIPAETRCWAVAPQTPFRFGENRIVNSDWGEIATFDKDWNLLRINWGAMPDMPLERLRTFRDSLNAIIYDKERGK